MLTIAADPRHLGGRIGITVVLRTWGSTMTHHPHVHMIVPGGGSEHPVQQSSANGRQREILRASYDSPQTKDRDG